MLLHLIVLFFFESRHSPCCTPKTLFLSPFGSNENRHHKRLCPCRPVQIKVCDSLERLSNALNCWSNQQCCDIKIVRGKKICNLDKVTCSKFIRVVLDIIICKRGKITICERDKAIEILKCICKYVGNSRNTLALFTASALHNTSYLKIFKENSKDFYASRGLLMIKNYDNYKILTKLSKINFLKCPDKLEHPSCRTIEAEAKFFKCLMKNVEYCFDNMMRVFNPKEYRIYTESHGEIKNDEWRNRYALYKLIKKKLK